MVIIGGLGSMLGPIFGAVFMTLLPIVTRRALEFVGGFFVARADLANYVPSLRLAIFGGLIIFFPGRGAGRPEPALAKHPDLVPDVAVFLLKQAQQGRAEMQY